jgi:hypothetical protein
VLIRDSWRIQSATAILLTSLLALPPQATAQTPNPGQSAGPPQTANPTAVAGESLKIYVLEGQNEIHDIHNRVPSMVVVEVRDENGQPLEGAGVTFQLPPVGPGGSFASQQYTYTTKTNFQGQAAATFTPNLQTGRFNIRVTARISNRTGQAVIAQSNGLRAGTTETKRGLFKFTWWKLAIVAGVGATVGTVLVTRGGSPTVTLIPGAPTFGAP